MYICQLCRGRRVSVTPLTGTLLWSNWPNSELVVGRDDPVWCTGEGFVRPPIHSVSLHSRRPPTFNNVSPHRHTASSSKMDSKMSLSISLDQSATSARQLPGCDWLLN